MVISLSGTVDCRGRGGNLSIEVVQGVEVVQLWYLVPEVEVSCHYPQECL